MRSSSWRSAENSESPRYLPLPITRRLTDKLGEIQSHYHQLSPRIRRTNTRRLGRVCGSQYLRVQLPGTLVPPLGAIRAHPVQTPAKPVSGERPTGIEDTTTSSKLRFMGRIWELVHLVQQRLAESQVQEELRSNCEGEEKRRTTKLLGLPSPYSA
jgi:hypothetical protein